MILGLSKVCTNAVAFEIFETIIYSSVLQIPAISNNFSFKVLELTPATHTMSEFFMD